MEAEAGRGGLAGTVMGWLREARPPLDKLELQTVETCEIRMEPSLLGCDPEDGAGGGSAVRVQTIPDAVSPSPPPALLFWFAFVWPDLKQEGMSQNDELKVFLKDGLCPRSHWKGKAEILWWYYKIAEADRWINPHDCISEPLFLFFYLMSVLTESISSTITVPTVVILAYLDGNRKLLKFFRETLFNGRWKILMESPDETWSLLTFRI